MLVIDNLYLRSRIWHDREEISKAYDENAKVGRSHFRLLLLVKRLSALLLWLWQNCQWDQDQTH